MFEFENKEEHFSGLDMLVMSLNIYKINIFNGIFYGHFEENIKIKHYEFLWRKIHNVQGNVVQDFMSSKDQTAKKQQQNKLLLL